MSTLLSWRIGCSDHSSKPIKWFQKDSSSCRPQSPSKDFPTWRWARGLTTQKTSWQVESITKTFQFKKWLPLFLKNNQVFTFCYHILCEHLWPMFGLGGWLYPPMPDNSLFGFHWPQAKQLVEPVQVLHAQWSATVHEARKSGCQRAQSFLNLEPHHGSGRVEPFWSFIEGPNV